MIEGPDEIRAALEAMPEEEQCVAVSKLIQQILRGLTTPSVAVTACLVATAEISAQNVRPECLEENLEKLGEVLVSSYKSFLELYADARQARAMEEAGNAPGTEQKQ